MKRNLFLLFALLLLSVQSFAQVSGSSFEMYALRYRFGPKSLAYFDTKNIEVTNFFADNAITRKGNPYKVNETKVRTVLQKLFPNANSGGKLVLDWEKKNVFYYLRNYPVTSSRYKSAEAEWRKLISIIRDERPNVKIGIYGIPFKGWRKSTVKAYNPDRKYDKLLSLVDFLAPSVYIQFADEEVGHARNLQYMQDIMDVALDYGKRLHKPVYPFLWARVHNTNPNYGSELIQIDVFAKYVRFLSTYTYNGYKAKGFYWWEALSKSENLRSVKGIKGWAKGMVRNFDSYDALTVKYAAAVVKTLAEPTTTVQKSELASVPKPVAASETSNDKNSKVVVSYTLLDAKTGKDIRTLSNGAVLNLADLPTKNLNIRYNTSSKVGSVKFSLSGEQSKSATESEAPYEIMGDNGKWTPAAGKYTLKATPYTRANATGSAGSSFTINFTIVSKNTSNTPQEESFTLINADTDKDIQTLTSGATINLAALPTKNLNIRYNAGSGMSSVVFTLSGAQNRKQTESGLPYALFTDTEGHYYGWTPSVGSYNLKATPYTENSGKGKAGSSLTINFSVVNNTKSNIGVSSVASNLTAGSTTGENSLSADVLTVYPVPATTVLYVELGQEAGEGEAIIELQDFSGQTVLTKKMNTATDGRKAELNVSSVKEGLYVLAVTSSAGRVTKRVVVD